MLSCLIYNQKLYKKYIKETKKVYKAILKISKSKKIEKNSKFSNKSLIGKTYLMLVIHNRDKQFLISSNRLIKYNPNLIRDKYVKIMISKIRLISTKTNLKKLSKL